MARLKPRERAQAAAWLGDIETAVAAFTSLQQQGDTASHAALAEIAAFQGRWDDVLQHAPVVTAQPTAVRTLNVYLDMITLVAVAGLELQCWSEVHCVAETAVAALEKVSLLPGHEYAARGLAAFAIAQGQVDYGWRPGSHDERPEGDRIAKYESGFARLSKDEKRFKTPQERRNHFIALAENCLLYDVAVALADAEGLPDIFDTVVFVASGLARQGRHDEAWKAIQTKLDAWWPVEDTQIAPVELLADDALRPLMTPERREEILRTPRGLLPETR